MSHLVAQECRCDIITKQKHHITRLLTRLPFPCSLCYPQVDDIFAHALKKQTGVSLRYMLDFGSNPIDRQLLLSAQFLHKELPVRLAHRVAELENLPYGLSGKVPVLKVCCRKLTADSSWKTHTAAAGSTQQTAAAGRRQQLAALERVPGHAASGAARRHAVEDLGTLPHPSQAGALQHHGQHAGVMTRQVDAVCSPRAVPAPFPHPPNPSLYAHATPGAGLVCGVLP